LKLVKILKIKIKIRRRNCGVVSVGRRYFSAVFDFGFGGAEQVSL